MSRFLAADTEFRCPHGDVVRLVGVAPERRVPRVATNGRSAPLLTERSIKEYLFLCKAVPPNKACTRIVQVLDGVVPEAQNAGSYLLCDRLIALTDGIPSGFLTYHSGQSIVTRSTLSATRPEERRRDFSRFRAKVKVLIDGRRPPTPLFGALWIESKQIDVTVDGEGVLQIDGKKNTGAEISLDALHEELNRHTAPIGRICLWPADGSANVSGTLVLPIRFKLRNHAADELALPTIEIAEQASPMQSTLDLIDRVYVNCGCWTDGQSDFAAVMGNEIILGSWAGIDNHRRVPHRSTPLLDRLYRGKTPRDRLHVTDHYLSLQEFIPQQDGLLVFIGDCHLHGMRNWPCDNFVRLAAEPSSSHAKPERLGMQKELSAFYAHLKDNVRPARIVQIGDMYEVWELQGLVEAAYEIIEDVYLGFPEEGTENEERYLRRLQSQKIRLPLAPLGLPRTAPDQERWSLLRQRARWLKHSFEWWDLRDGSGLSLVARASRDHDWRRTRAALLSYFNLSDDPAEPHAIAASFFECVTLPDAIALFEYRLGKPISIRPNGDRLRKFLSQWGSFRGKWTNVPETIERIRDVHPELSKFIHDPLVQIIEGNHDRSIANQYLEGLAKHQSADAKRKELAALVAHKLDFEHDPYGLLSDSFQAAGGRLVYEHGQACDKYNNDKDYFRAAWDLMPPRGGYFGARDRILEELEGGNSEIVDLAVNFYLRCAADRRARRIFESKKGRAARVVVLGHTHQPRIVRSNLAPVPPSLTVRTVDINLSRGQVKDVLRDDDVHLSQVVVRCERGTIEVSLQHQRWWNESQSESRILTRADGPWTKDFAYEQPPDRLFYGAYDQDNIVRVSALDDARVHVELTSLRRKDVTGL